MRAKIEAFISQRRSPEGENFLFPSEDWRYEVDNGDTSAGFEGWLEGKIEIETDEASDAVERLLRVATECFTESMGEPVYCREILSLCSDLRIANDDVADAARNVLGIKPEDHVFGEICGNIPSDMVFDLSRIMHLGLLSYTGRCDLEKMDKAVVDFAERHELECAPVTRAMIRLGLEDNPDLG